MKIRIKLVSPFESSYPTHLGFLIVRGGAFFCQRIATENLKSLFPKGLNPSEQILRKLTKTYSFNYFLLLYMLGQVPLTKTQTLMNFPYAIRYFFFKVDFGPFGNKL